MVAKASGGMRRINMNAGVSIGSDPSARLEPHPLRATVLGEVHARPFTPIATPGRALLFAFQTTAEQAKADRSALQGLCETPRPHRAEIRREASPRLHRHDHAALGAAFGIHHLYFRAAGRSGAAPFHPAASSLASPMGLLPQPGPLLAAIDLHLVAEGQERIAPERMFDRRKPRRRGKFRRHCALCDRFQA